MPLPEEVLHRLRHMKLSWDMAEFINGDLLSLHHSRQTVEIAMYVLCCAEDIARAQNQEIVTVAHWNQALKMLQTDETDTARRNHQPLEQKHHQRKRRTTRKAQKAARRQTRRHR